MVKINIPETGQKRVVIVGGGFAGLQLARKLTRSDYQIVLIDKHNYHQFQPLFYQVAMAGLEPSSIAFPLRKLFQHNRNVFIRVTEVESVDTTAKRLETPHGIVNYDYLVLAMGADTNFFGNEELAKRTLPMKSVPEALYLRNQILQDYEEALTIPDYDARQELIDIVIVGGGATGVEVAGSLAEMKRYVLPKDYPELDCDEIDIYLIQGGDQLLQGMSDESSQKALEFLQELGVKVILNRRVQEYDGEKITMDNGETIPTKKVIWAAGIKANELEGLPEKVITYGKRIKVNRFNQIEGFEDIFAIGDMAYMEEPDFPKGHPQVAQVAIQQAKRLGKNLIALTKGKAMEPFSYRDLGSMATIGRNRAVVDLPKFKFQGFFAWLIWLFVHLFSIVGVKNKIFVFLNWVWNYFTYDQSLRLIFKVEPRPELEEQMKSDRVT